MPRGGHGYACIGWLLLVHGLPVWAGGGGRSGQKGDAIVARADAERRLDSDQAPFYIEVDNKESQDWAACWENVSHGGKEGLRVKRIPPEGILHEWNEAHPHRLVLPKDVVIEVQRVHPDPGSSARCGDMKAMLAKDGSFKIKLLHDAQVPAPVNVTLRKPRNEPIGLGWIVLSPESGKTGLRITKISGGGVFDRHNDNDTDHEHHKIVMTGDTIIQVCRTDPGEAGCSQENAGMEDLLHKVGMLEVIVKREAPRDSYACSPGLNNLPSEWAAAKRTWCCEKFSHGCDSEVDDVLTAAGAESTTPSQTDAYLYNCDAALDKFDAAWSPDKKEWCCTNEQKGCKASARESSATTSKPTATDQSFSSSSVTSATQEAKIMVVVSGNAVDAKFRDVVKWTIKSLYGYTSVHLQPSPRKMDTAQGQVLHYDMLAHCPLPGCELNRPPKENSNSDFRAELQQQMEAHKPSVTISDAAMCFGNNCELTPGRIPWAFLVMGIGIITLIALNVCYTWLCVGDKNPKAHSLRREAVSPKHEPQAEYFEEDNDAPWLGPPQPQEPPTETLFIPEARGAINWLDGLPGMDAELDAQRWAFGKAP